MKLKAIHAATHPARVKRPGGAAERSIEANLAPPRVDVRSALLNALAAEADNDDDGADDR